MLEAPLSREQLYPFALAGEAVASGGLHGDNVGAMLLGGIVLSTADKLVRVPAPDAWHCVLVHPNLSLETRRAREVLQGAYQLRDFVSQSANLALVLSGCSAGDADLVRAGLNDVLVEPRRASLIPGFHRVKQAALDHGALGASISGAGPSVFAWFESLEAATKATESMRGGFASAEQIDSEAFPQATGRLAGVTGTLSPGRSAHRGGSPGVAVYQDVIDHRVTTIDPGGCAAVRSQRSVDVISQTSGRTADPVI